jgi:hypothetical protein
MKKKEVGVNARFNAEKRNKSEKMPTKEDFERPYVSKYKPNSRFMITVQKDAELPDHGVILTEYKSKWKSEIYVAEVEPHGPFYKTGMCVGYPLQALVHEMKLASFLTQNTSLP